MTLTAARATGSATYFLPRDLHPAAWWVWALGLAVAASRTTNPWLLGLVIAVACYVVVARRSAAPWAMAFRIYVYLAVFIVTIRVAVRILFGGDEGGTVLLRLPQIPLPDWVAGVQLLGTVSAESLLGGFYDGLRLAAMVICLGAANALANPKRLLRSMPSALYEVGAAVVVAISVFPQLAESLGRVRRARRLRGDHGKGLRSLRSLVIPVLEDALDRSISLAASMDARGYGRTGSPSRFQRSLTGALMITGLVGVCIGVYATVDLRSPRYLATPMLLVGVALASAGFVAAGRRVERTRYRPDRWRAAEVLTALSGVVTATVVVVLANGSPLGLYSGELAWPQLAWPPLCGVLVSLLPAVLTPPPQVVTT